MRSLAWLAPWRCTTGRDRSGEESRVRGRSGNDRSKGQAPRVRRTRKGRVLPRCAVSYFQPDIGDSATVVLEALGYEVIVPDGLKCCGRPYLSLATAPPPRTLHGRMPTPCRP